MSKQRSEIIEGYKLFFEEYGIEDLVYNIETLTEVKAAGLNKDQVLQIASDFYKMLCEDLILNNNCFHLPDRFTGLIYIKDIANVNSKEYVYDFVREGKFYQPVILNSGKSTYIARFTGAMKELFDKEVLTNKHQY